MFRAWSLQGNAGTDDTNNFIGTTDSQDLVFRANNTEAIRINQSNGFIGFNEVNPTSPLHINRDLADGIGIIRVEGTEPDINFNDTDGGFNTFTFENNGVPLWAFGRRSSDDFYITRNAGGFINETFNIIRSNGFVGINNENPSAQLDINQVDAASPPLRIRPSASTPTGTESGQFHVASDGLLYTFDSTRNKWLSVDRNLVGWGRNSGSASNEFLRQFNGSLSDTNGWRMIRNGTITAITVQSNNVDTFDIQIRSNDNAAPITTFTVTNAEGDHDTTLNIDFNEGDFLQCFLPAVPGGVSNPQVLIEIAWRQ